MTDVQYEAYCVWEGLKAGLKVFWGIMEDAQADLKSTPFDEEPAAIKRLEDMLYDVWKYIEGQLQELDGDYFEPLTQRLVLEGIYDDNSASGEVGEYWMERDPNFQAWCSWIDAEGYRHSETLYKDGRKEHSVSLTKEYGY